MVVSSMDNAIAALGQSNRVRRVDMHLKPWQFGEALAAMQVPFPELTDLRLLSSFSDYKKNLVPTGIPNSFLGGSAPLLRHLTLRNIPFRGLPKLLLSVTHLVRLELTRTPRSGYIPPEAMTDLLSVLSCLRILSLEFRKFRTQSRSLPPPKHSVLPSLSEFRFTGFTRYLETLVTHIDTPQLDEMHIGFINSSNFDCPRLAQFINRTPTLWARDKAHLRFDKLNTNVTLLARSSTLKIETRCSLETFVHGLCNSSLHPLSTVEDLYIEHQHRKQQFPTENTQWLQLLLSFTAVKNLLLFEKVASGIAATLQGLVGGRITEVLPSLQHIFVEAFDRSGPFRGNIRQFVNARQLSGHPVTISIRGKVVWNWEEEVQESV
jgi:hypothetical protein